MIRTRVLALAAFVCCTFATATTTLLAGPLSPPAGPVASTPGPEPRIAINAANTPGDANSIFKITQPGSYYLTGNILGAASRKGIEIDADNVTIDLMGFEVRGVPGSFAGITYDSVIKRNTVIRNGAVVSWGGSGIDLLGGAADNSGSIIESIVASNNTFFGIRCGVNGIIRNCSANSNSNTGIVGFEGSTISNCSASFNGSVGIAIGNGGTVTASTARNNSSDGFSALNGGTFVNCTAYENGGRGFSLGARSFISASSANTNGTEGIFVNSDSTVLNNNTSNNGATSTSAGILVAGSGSRIEGNNSARNDIGIRVTSAGNIIIRNTCSNNTTAWDIAANNTYGPIIDRRIPSPIASTPAVLGTTASSTLGSTDPNANFTH